MRQWKFTEVVKLLNKSNIRFYITSSFAVSIYTDIQIYSDIDLVVDRKDISKIEEIFSEKFERINFGRRGSATSMRLGPTVELACFDNIYKNGSKFNLGFNDTTYNRCKEITVDRVPVKIIPIEELIILKLVLDRNNNGKNDRDHVCKLLKVKGINWFYLFRRGYEVGLLLHLVRLRL